MNLNLLDEVREHACINLEALKRRVELSQKTKMKPRQFKVVDLVMRKAHPYELENKLSSKWTVLFRIVEVLGNGVYRLETITIDGLNKRGGELFYEIFLQRLDLE